MGEDVLVEVDRDISSIRLPKWGRVVKHEGIVPWLVVDEAGRLVEPVRRYLTDFVAMDAGESSASPMVGLSMVPARTRFEATSGVNDTSPPGRPRRSQGKTSIMARPGPDGRAIG